MIARTLVPRFDRRMKPRLGARLDTSHPLSRGLVGCWLMNEGAGSVVRDKSETGSHGTVTGAVWLAGMSGPTLTFGTANAHVTMGTCPDILKFNSGQNFSVVARVLSTEKADNTLIANDYATASGGWFFGQASSTTQACLMFYAGSSGVSGLSNSLTLNVWHQVCAIWKASARSVSFYIDGKFSSTPPALTADVGYTNTRPLVIGVDPRDLNAVDWSGSMDFVYVWARTISPAEIQSLYLDPYQMFRNQPVELWSAASGGAQAPSFKPYWIPRRRQIIGAGVM